MKVRPLHDRLIVQRLEEEEKTKGGIIIPDTAKEKPIEGKVIAVGAGRSRMDVKRRIDHAVEEGVKELKKLSKPVKEQKEIAQVGTISANNDRTIGDIIAEAMNKVG